MAKIRGPDPFDFADPTTWTVWKRRFLRYKTASELNKKDNDVQIDTLIYTMGAEAEAISSTFTYAPPANNYDESKDFVVVLRKFDEHFVPKRNTIHERAKFNTRIQQPEESVEQFVRALYTLSEHCQFENKDNAIRDRIVIGLTDSRVSKELQEVGDTLTCAKAIEKARNTELVANNDAQKATQSKASEVNAVRGRWQPRGRGGFKGRSRGRGRYQNKSDGNKQPGRGETTQTQNQDEKCKNCYRYHPQYRCPAFHKNCARCGVRGDFAVACSGKMNNKPNGNDRKLYQVSEYQNDTAANSEPYFLGTVTQDGDEVDSHKVNACIAQP